MNVHRLFSPNQVACALTVAAALTLLATPAWAQRIRSYDAPTTSGTTTGSQANTGGGTTYIPGMPAPPQRQAPAGEGDAGAEQANTGSYGTVFRPQAGMRSNTTLGEVLNLPLERLYSGVIPGTRDQVTHLSDAHQKGEATASPNRVTWIGFLPKDDVTRVFVQTARRADYEIGRGSDGPTVVVTLRNTKIPARNFSRFIDTSFFGRSVTRIEADQVDRNTVKMTIKLRANESPRVDQENGYLYFDFPHSSAAGDAS